MCGKCADSYISRAVLVENEWCICFSKKVHILVYTSNIPSVLRSAILSAETLRSQRNGIFVFYDLAHNPFLYAPPVGQAKYTIRCIGEWVNDSFEIHASTGLIECARRTQAVCLIELLEVVTCVFYWFVCGVERMSPITWECVSYIYIYIVGICCCALEGKFIGMIISFGIYKK